MSLTDIFLCVPFSHCCSTHLFRLVEGRGQGRSMCRLAQHCSGVFDRFVKQICAWVDG